MNNMELQRVLLQAFSEEAPELIVKVERGLFGLESSPEDASVHMDTIKRPLHSLKGSSSVIERADLCDVCHAMEDILFEYPASDDKKSIIDRLYKGLAFITLCVSAPSEPRDNRAILALLSKGNNDVKPAESATPVHSGVVHEQPVQLVAVPAGENLRDAELLPALTETIRVATDKIENIQSAVGEVVAIRLQQEDSLSNLSDMQLLISRLNMDWRNISQDLRDVRKAMDNTRASKLDAKLTNISNCLKSLQRQSFHLSNQMGNQNAQLTLLSDELDNSLRAVRMMPIRPFLESYRSTARDAARLLGKSVLLECSEAGIEVDRLILEQIKDPLLHMVRNSVGHGIEFPEQRLKSGKPEAGRIRLTAELNGDFVLIHVEDDGAGFDCEKIFRKAFEKGLAKNIDEITNNKIIELVCMPGFSTADTTNTVSGRGVGMDVVATMISELGGALALETTRGKGSVFTLQVPASLATSQGLLLQVGASCYGVMLDMVERIVRKPIEDLDTIEGKRVLYLDDDPIAVTSLASILGLNHLEPAQIKKHYPIVILRTASHRLAMIVDDVPGEIPMIVKPLGPQYENIRLYSGGAILSDGSVLPVIEARQVVNLVMESHSYRLGDVELHEEGPADNLPGNESKNRKSILVVDDSITTRTLERNILEAAGYRVMVATDGIEAIDILTLDDDIAMVVTDLEMPRMGGLDLCRKIRSGRHHNMPIVMVTSVGNDSERQKGLEAGADAYIVKGNFQQDHFLATVRRFINA